MDSYNLLETALIDLAYITDDIQPEELTDIFNKFISFFNEDLDLDLPPLLKDEDDEVDTRRLEDILVELQEHYEQMAKTQAENGS